MGMLDAPIPMLFPCFVQTPDNRREEWEVKRASFTIRLAATLPEGAIGIGGSPGRSVLVKAGATALEPLVTQDASGYLRMDIDKGNQVQEGKDMIDLGDIAHPELTESAGGSSESRLSAARGVPLRS